MSGGGFFYVPAVPALFILSYCIHFAESLSVQTLLGLNYSLQIKGHQCGSLIHRGSSFTGEKMPTSQWRHDMAFNGARLPIVRRKSALFWLHGVNKMFCAACVCIVLQRSLFLKPLSDSLLPPQQMHTIKHCNDLFSPRSTASL